MLLVAPVGPFVLGNLEKNPKFERNSIHLWGFWDFGGLYCSVVAVRGGAVVENTCGGLWGQRQSDAALSPEPIAKKGPDIHGPPGAAAI
jgi:hypothetical protein